MTELEELEQFKKTLGPVTAEVAYERAKKHHKPSIAKQYQRYGDLLVKHHETTIS